MIFMKECDYITVHVPALDSYEGHDQKMHLGHDERWCDLLNFARDVLVDSDGNDRCT